MARLAKEGVALSFDVRPDEREALRYLGYSGQVLDEGVEERYAAAEAKCAEFQARGVFRVFPCAEAGESADGVCLEGAPLVLPGADITRHLEGSVAVVLLAATLGHEADRAIRREMALSPTNGAILSAAASSQVEAAVEVLHDCVRTWAAERGLRAGDRFSPGYGDLPLSVQPAFLDVVNAGKLLGVTTTPANFLAPSKSITAIVGLFKGEEPAADSEKGKPARCGAAACSMKCSSECPLKRDG